MTQCAKCGQTFTESPIWALYEHYQANHGPVEVRYPDDKPLAPSQEATEWFRRNRSEQRRRYYARKARAS